MSDLNTILRINASARVEGSVSRQLSQKTVEHFSEQGSVKLIDRDLTEALPFVDQDWINANFTPASERNAKQTAKMSLSDSLVAELQAADTIVIGTPIYNFSIPASLKAWVDMVARVGVTFRYTDKGPEGLLSGKQAIVVLASGGTQMGSEIDFATPYLRHALKFIGITDVTFIAADGLGTAAESKIESALQAIKAL